jgi:hypothetical protein
MYVASLPNSRPARQEKTRKGRSTVLHIGQAAKHTTGEKAKKKSSRNPALILTSQIYQKKINLD